MSNYWWSGGARGLRLLVALKSGLTGWGHSPRRVLPIFMRLGANRRHNHRHPLRRAIAEKARGRFLYRGTALSVRFFEALVRLPNHNAVMPRSFAPREPGPRSSSLFRHHSLQELFRCPSRLSFPIHSTIIVDSLPLEDRSSVEVIVLAKHCRNGGPKRFSLVEMTALMWKVLYPDLASLCDRCYDRTPLRNPRISTPSQEA